MLQGIFNPDNYSWNAYAIPQLICSIYFFAMGLFILHNNPRSKVNISFFFSCAAIFMWQFGTMMILLSRTDSIASFWSRFIGTGVVFIPTTLYIFISYFLKIKGLVFKYFSIVASIIFAWLCISTHLILDTPKHFYYGYYFTKGVLHPFFLLFFCVAVGRFWYFLYLEYKRVRLESNPIKTVQMKYMFLAFTLLVFASADFIPMYLEYSFYPAVSFIFVLLFTTTISYAIIRHRLMDVDVVIRRSIVGIALLAAALFLHTAIIIFTQQYVGYILSSFLSMIIIVSLLFFRPVRNTLQQGLERFIYRGRYNYQEVLKQSSKALVSILHLDNLLSYMVKLIVENFDTKKVSVFLIKEEASDYRIAASYGLNKETIDGFKLSAANGMVKWLSDNKSVFVKDEKELYLPRDEFDKIYGNLKDVGAEVVIPIFYKDRLKGVLNIGHKGSGTVYNQQDMDVLDSLADSSAIAIENAFLYEEAITDGLTKVYHHKYFLMRLKEELSRSRRYKYPLSLIMMDIDYFKSFNDKYGHLAGDEVLKGVAYLAKKNLRESDIIARYGGEEFAILLPHTSLEGAEVASARLLSKVMSESAVQIAERIRKNIELGKFTILEQDLRITVSMGVASLDGQELIDSEEIISHADKALYKAKELGRNRIEVYGGE